MRIVHEGEQVWIAATSGIGGRWVAATEAGVVFPGDATRDSLYVPASLLREHTHELLGLLTPKKGRP